MKKSLLILLFCMIANYVHAQILIRVGYGSNYNTPTTFPTPFPDAVEGNRQQYLYRASDLTAFGMTKGIISSIGFDVRGTNPGAGEIENYTIKMGLTTATRTDSETVTAMGISHNNRYPWACHPASPRVPTTTPLQTTPRCTGTAPTTSTPTCIVRGSTSISTSAAS